MPSRTVKSSGGDVVIGCDLLDRVDRHASTHGVLQPLPVMTGGGRPGQQSGVAQCLFHVDHLGVDVPALAGGGQGGRVVVPDLAVLRELHHPGEGGVDVVRRGEDRRGLLRQLLLDGLAVPLGLGAVLGLEPRPRRGIGGLVVHDRAVGGDAELVGVGKGVVVGDPALQGVDVVRRVVQGPLDGGQLRDQDLGIVPRSSQRTAGILAGAAVPVGQFPGVVELVLQPDEFVLPPP
jgi:hypothetical protein